jgi:hypothetical protein
MIMAATTAPMDAAIITGLQAPWGDAGGRIFSSLMVEMVAPPTDLG